jgi:FkbM family methyltransferase
MISFPRDITAAEIRSLVGAEPLIAELGAHDGQDTAEFLEAMPHAEIVCFEPDPRPLARLRQRFAGDDRVRIVPYACSDHNGSSVWYQSHGQTNTAACVNGDWDYSSSLRRPTGHIQRSREVSFSQTAVECVRIDDWCGANEPRPFDFIWADIQGAQVSAARGGRRAFNESRFIYIELHFEPLYDGEPTFDELTLLFRNHQAIGRYAENVLFRNINQ